MATASTYTTAQQGTADRLVATFASLIERARKARTYRKTLNALNDLPDEALADLGLHRSMLNRVAHQAVYED